MGAKPCEDARRKERAGDPARSLRSTCWLFAIVVVGTGLGGMTQTALNTMAAVVLADVGADLGWGQWLTTLYIFAMGAAVPLASFLQRRFSVRALMFSAFILYLVGSLCDAFAIDLAMLLVGRVMEALATGVLMPLLQTIAMTRFPEHRHGTAMGIAGIALGFAPNIGPVVGGVLCEAVGWRFLFFGLSAASVILIAFTFAIVKERDVREPSTHLDWASLSLSTIGFGGILLGFTAAANMAPIEPLVWMPVVAGAAAVVLFVRRQRMLAQPLIDLRIFSFKPYRRALVVQCLLYGCFVGMTLIIPLTVIEGAGHTVAEAGAVLFPGALAALVFEPAAGAASDRFGVRRVAIFGGIFLAFGAVGIAFVPLSAPLWVFAAFQALRCVGLTTLIPSTTAWGLGPLGKESITADGSAALIMVRQIFAALATAIMVLVVVQAQATGAGWLGFHGALAFSGALGLACLVCVFSFVRKEPCDG